MRIDSEIIERIKEIEPRDFLGFERVDLIAYLSFEAAQPFIEEGTTAEEWAEFSRGKDSAVLEEITDYMPFAWKKANGCRGISANRSMSHFNAWTWLLGDDFGDLTNYEFYGKDNLVRICEKYGLDHTQWDDGIRSNTED